MRHPILLLVIVACACSKPQVISADADACAAVRSIPQGSARFHPYGHAHNDYEHPRPLLDALDAKFYSVEADLWLRGGEIVVSHDAVSQKGTLKALYLDPLQALVTSKGSVHGDGVQFVLWLDLKDGSEALRTALAELLDQYPMLSVYTDDATTEGAVTAVLTGVDASKKAFVNERSTRRAVRDSNDYSTEDPRADKRWSWYALDWTKYMTWDGTLQIPDSERTRLGCLVGDIHAKGRRVRFWKGPESEAYRKVAIETGVDLIGTDELQSLSDFLSGTPSPP